MNPSVGEKKARARSWTDLYRLYTGDLKGEDVEALFTRETREAYRFFTAEFDEAEWKNLPFFKRIVRIIRNFFLGLTVKMSPVTI